jgi:hypothetical protein
MFYSVPDNLIYKLIFVKKILCQILARQNVERNFITTANYKFDLFLLIFQF